MELRWLEAFVALAETHSIRAAAGQLQISPATLAERISALEDYLGARLIEREVKGSHLTEQGKLYLRDARRLINDWHVIVGKVQAADSHPVHHLRIAFQERVFPPVVGRFLDEFLVRHPDIMPSFYNDQEIGIAEGLNGGQLDLYFAYCPLEPSCVGLVKRPVFRTRLGVLVPGKHRLAWKRSISLSELEGETLLLYPETREVSLRERELEALRAAKIRFFLFEGHLSPLYYTMPVQMGQGIAIVPWLLRDHKPPRIASIPLTDPLCQCTIDMLYHPENDNPALQTFLEEFGTQEGDDDP